MLSDADEGERDILGAIGYAPNTVYSASRRQR